MHNTTIGQLDITGRWQNMSWSQLDCQKYKTSTEKHKQSIPCKEWLLFSTSLGADSKVKSGWKSKCHL